MAAREAWLEFDALVELLDWGRNTYTILRLTGDLEAAARSARTRRVEGTIEDVPVNVGVNRADVVPDAFMYVGKSMRRRLDVRPGDVVRCRLRPADPDEVPLAEDVRAVLADSGRLKVFLGLSPAERRRLLATIEDAATSPTRERRVRALVRTLGPGA